MNRVGKGILEKKLTLDTKTKNISGLNREKR